MADLQNCEEIILSEDYGDMIIEYSGDPEQIQIDYNNPPCIQIINNRYAIIHTRTGNLIQTGISHYPICVSPVSLYLENQLTLQDTSALEDAGITPLFTQPFLQLRGTGTLIAVIDSGIDYRHPAFIYEDNTTKIASIWDMTIAGSPPAGFMFGTEYTADDINAALSSHDPLSIVPSMDELGHGTFTAGVAAGRAVPVANFSGSAPDAELIIVKLKAAKNIFRELFLVSDQSILYQSNDVMLALKYVSQKADEISKPLVICLPLGTNQGGHDGRTYLEEYMNVIATSKWVTIITPTGNETTRARHALIPNQENNTTASINIRVAGDTRGFLLYIWGQAPDSFSVGVITPSGESVQPLTSRLSQSDTISFILEPTTILIEYQLLENRSGDPLALLRFDTPSQGIWTINVRKDTGVNQDIHLWLPCCDWVSESTFFLEPNADTTITVPASANLAITAGGYNHRTGSMFIYSSRGNTRFNLQKPDFLAPAMNIYGPLPNKQYGNRSGTSIAAAITAGAAALLYQWGVSRDDIPINSRKIRNLLIKGAKRNPNTIYPNKESGYGTLNLLNTFNVMRRNQ